VWPLVFVAAALLVATALQAATGFGFALLAGPAVFVALPPARGVALLLILGLAINVLVLYGERRRPDVDPEVRVALLAALPGLVAGALLLRALPADALRVAIGAVVLVLVVARLRPPRRARPHGPRGAGVAALAGLAAGALTTSTTTNGPPLALWLAGRGLTPAVVRDTASAAFLALDVAGLVAVLAVVGVHESLADARLLVVLLPLVGVGHRAGSWLFRRLPGHRYEQVLLTAVAATGLVSVVSGLR
jgi:uncharacterized membrane protein YfcA